MGRVGLATAHVMVCGLERRYDCGNVDTRTLLFHTENRWCQLEDAHVLMEQPRNDKAWLRPWRRALAEFTPFWPDTDTQGARIPLLPR